MEEDDKRTTRRSVPGKDVWLVCWLTRMSHRLPKEKGREQLTSLSRETTSYKNAANEALFWF